MQWARGLVLLCWWGAGCPRFPFPPWLPPCALRLPPSPVLFEGWLARERRGWEKKREGKGRNGGLRASMFTPCRDRARAKQTEGGRRKAEGRPREPGQTGRQAGELDEDDEGGHRTQRREGNNQPFHCSSGHRGDAAHKTSAARFFSLRCGMSFLTAYIGCFGPWRAPRTPAPTREDNTLLESTVS